MGSYLCYLSIPLFISACLISLTVVFFPSGKLDAASQTNHTNIDNSTMMQNSAGYKEVSPTSSHKENSSSLLNQLANLPGFNPLKARIVKQYAKTPEEILPTAVEKSLPWRRDRSTYNFGMCSMRTWTFNHNRICLWRPKFFF